jgi:hypothetical protein
MTFEFFPGAKPSPNLLPVADAHSVDFQVTFVNKSLHFVNNFPKLLITFLVVNLSGLILGDL